MVPSQRVLAEFGVATFHRLKAAGIIMRPEAALAPPPWKRKPVPVVTLAAAVGPVSLADTGRPGLRRHLPTANAREEARRQIAVEVISGLVSPRPYGVRGATRPFLTSVRRPRLAICRRATTRKLAVLAIAIAVGQRGRLRPPSIMALYSPLALIALVRDGEDLGVGPQLGLRRGPADGPPR